jgi:hypothetical protein
MKRMLTALLIVLSSGVCGEKLDSILYPSNQVVQKACTDSFKAGQAVDFEKELFELTSDDNGFDTVRFQTPLGGVKSACASDAQSLEVKPHPTNTKSLFAMVVASGTVSDLPDARRWNAVMIARNSKGKELARVMPDALSQKGQLNNWEVSCADGCKWTGSNYYFFQLSNNAFRKAVFAGASVFVVNQERGEIITYPVRTPSQVELATPEPVAEKTVKPKATKSGFLSDTVTYVSLPEFAKKMPNAELSDEVGGATLFLNNGLQTGIFRADSLKLEGTFETRSLPGLPVFKDSVMFVPVKAFEAFGCSYQLTIGNNKQIEVTCQYTDNLGEAKRATVKLMRF